jgi:hypothetical protein
MMTSRQRLLAALTRQLPDRLPVTTHHLMPSFLESMGGLSERQFFDRFGLDAVRWVAGVQDTSSESGRSAGLQARDDDAWRVSREDIPDPSYRTTRIRIATPRGELSMVLQDDGRTEWVRERLVKEKRDIELIAGFAPIPLCDVAEVNRAAEEFGNRGIVRGAVPGFPYYGQPGCWQDAAVFCGTDALILETFDDPSWVNEFLAILHRRKLAWLKSSQGARFDVIELGGGDASSTVISPRIFERFVAPFDSALISAAHAAGQRIVYHTCGGMMPILEQIAAMGPDAMETFTPTAMGGDANLAEAKRRIGDRVCMIGGFDQFHHFVGCAPEETRRAVRRCFEEAGAGGGYVLAPSDHFFEAETALLDAYADEAKACRY